MMQRSDETIGRLPLAIGWHVTVNNQAPKAKAPKPKAISSRSLVTANSQMPKSNSQESKAKSSKI